MLKVKMTLYVDIILLENIVMNYIILLATALISKSKVNKFKILLSSFLGSAYAVISFLKVLEIYSTLFLKIVLSVIMIYIAFNPPTIKKIVKQTIMFYLTSFAFGGCAFFLLYYIKPQDIFIQNGVFIGTYPLKIALLGGILGFIIVNIGFKFAKGKLEKNNMYCDIKIQMDGKSTIVKAMIDTGNLLKEPISKTPVIIVEKNSLKEIFEKEIIEDIKNIMLGNKIEISEKYLSKMKVIPFTSLGKQNGMLIGIKVDKVIIKYDDDEKEMEGIIVGIYEKTLSKNQKYTALVGLDLIQEKA